MEFAARAHCSPARDSDRPACRDNGRGQGRGRYLPWFPAGRGAAASRHRATCDGRTAPATDGRGATARGRGSAAVLRIAAGVLLRARLWVLLVRPLGPAPLEPLTARCSEASAQVGRAGPGPAV